MAIDIKTEHIVTFKEAARYLPRHPAISTLQRWRLYGIEGVKLETIRIGGIRYTSLEALQRFADATTAAVDARAGPSQALIDVKCRPVDRSVDRRQRCAAEILDEAGI